MTARLLSPSDVAAAVAKHVNTTWAERVCAEVAGGEQHPFSVAVRSGVTGTASVERVGFDVWHDWKVSWGIADLSGVPGARVESSDVTVAGNRSAVPHRLHGDTLESALGVLCALGGKGVSVDIDRARNVAARLREAGAEVTPATLKSTVRLTDADIDVVIDAVGWLEGHTDLSEWTTRQLPVPGMHSKWLSGHENLLRSLIGRDIRVETRPRLSVAHFTYVDPDYLATGGRRHDAWMTGDHHKVAYLPRNVLVVENRDCRLWFPELPDTIVVEGNGKAAASSLAGIDWITEAATLVYWGDIDSDGFAILDHLRSELQPRGIRVDSILMDAPSCARYAEYGVNRDRRGAPLTAATARLPHLTSEEAEAYASVATAGHVPFRRIEQEKIDLADAKTAFEKVIAKVATPGHE
ncbi:DUF3322 and DUF2220 domain-containing protein [Leifsonia flava]|uniref:DUF3322 and DUF2220 domain-containing protein n=1 Tax=Orlajensenia leifsoniae TaxID=2561933 RepID=A0A4Y9QSL6_9MICO|nr:Wadjet anti-phage system protein JetD domain-containing protein [Leifsonia flava]TFV94878.1 DUF3322 and DUF2220 domain-containing protein [Leifsonia flava]